MLSFLTKRTSNSIGCPFLFGWGIRDDLTRIKSLVNKKCAEIKKECAKKQLKCEKM